jgi:hypothetical protein
MVQPFQGKRTIENAALGFSRAASMINRELVSPR